MSHANAPTPAPSTAPSEPKQAERRGRRAETLACWYLRLHGWRISRAAPVSRRRSRYRRAARAHPGVRRGKGARRREAADFALDHRLRRVAVAAERLAPRFMRDGDDVRIDAMFIIPGRWPRHLTNVWQG